MIFKNYLLKKSLFLLSLLLLFSICFSATPPYMIEVDFNSTTPSRILGSLSMYEALPIDGNLLKLSASWKILSNQSQAYTPMYNEVLPLKGKYTKLEHCWIFVGKENPGDWFNDWSVCIQNFANVAQVCKDFGLEGIILDPENTSYTTWEYASQPQAGSKTEDQYRAQARLQGKAIMEACVKIYPQFKIMFLHGPYISEPNTPSNVRRDQYGSYPSEYRLMGSFFVGFTQGTSALGNVIDGGEIYQYRTLQDFKDSYTWRKYTIASAGNNSPNIPSADRTTFPSKVSIGYGLMPYGWPNASDVMSAPIMRTAAEYALKTCDSYVWWFGGKLDDKDYMAALKGACDAAKIGVNFTSSENVWVATGASFGYKVKYSNTTGSTATLTYLKKPSWITATLDTIYGIAPTVVGYDTVKALVAAGTKSDTLNLKINVSAYYSFEAEDCNLLSLFTVGNDATASRGKYISTPVGAGKQITPKIEATHTVNIPQAGNYYVWALINSVASNNDVGTFVGFNTKFDATALKTVKTGAYEWVRSAKPFTLTAGLNDFNLCHGNEQARIDKIVITTSADVILPPAIQTAITKNEMIIKTGELNLTLNKATSNGLQFLVSLQNNQEYNFKLINVSGRTIFTKNVADGKLNSYINLTAKVNSGLYLAVLRQNNNVLNKKIVIVR